MALLAWFLGRTLRFRGAIALTVTILVSALAGSPGTSTFGANSPGKHRIALNAARAGSLASGKSALSGQTAAIVGFLQTIMIRHSIASVTKGSVSA